MALTIYIVHWDALAIPGFIAIPKSSGFSTVEGANSFAVKLMDAGKVNVSIAAPVNCPACEVGTLHATRRGDKICSACESGKYERGEETFD